jgi:hypothetical protein
MRWIATKRYGFLSFQLESLSTKYHGPLANFPAFQLSVEIMVTIAALKSCIAWIWTWVINDFITASGVISVFMTVAAINLAVYLAYIPFYLKGKDIRIWLHRKDLLRSAGLI